MLPVSPWNRSNKQTTPPKIDTRRLRIAVACKYAANHWADKQIVAAEKRAKDQMVEAARVLNVIEKYLKWPKSKVSLVEGTPKGCPVFLLTGSGKWLVSPQLMSLYLLFVRLASRPSVTGKLKKFCLADLKEMSKTSIGHGADANFYRQVYKHLPMLFENIDRVFFSRTLRDNYHSWSGSTGINNMMVNVNQMCRKIGGKLTPLPKHDYNHPATMEFVKIKREAIEKRSKKA
jgi:hypothetical protein